MSLMGLIPDSDPNQTLRVKRFLMAALVYLLTIGLMGLYVLEDLMPMRAWVGISGLIVVFNLGVYVFLRSGRNERLSDPSLTGLQMVAACLLLGLTMYFVDQSRGALLLLYLVLLMFGVLRLWGWQYSLVGLLALASYACAIFAVLRLRPSAVDLREETLQLLALAAMVPAGGFFAAYVGRLRQTLRHRQLELQRARETVYELRLQDQLTGVRNRHSIVELLEHELARAQRLDLPLSLVIVDLDQFKQVNRDYGHQRGDALMRRVADRLRKSLRSIDGIGRYGGDEFLVVLPDTDAVEADRAAQRLLGVVTECRLDNVPSAPMLSASVGVAERAPDDTPWSLIERARYRTDLALEQGGGRIVVAGSVPQRAH
jgi:diguanylate cyclase (GGDEF)-like protein